jgi:uncharacterized lipoprotein YmbA
MKGRLMKRVVVVHAVLFAAVIAVLLAGCSSTSETSNPVLKFAENEALVAGHQAGCAAAAFGSVPMEVTMPLWAISGN